MGVRDSFREFVTWKNENEESVPQADYGKKPLKISVLIAKKPEWMLCIVLLLLAVVLGVSATRPFAFNLWMRGGFWIRGDVTALRQDALDVAKASVKKVDKDTEEAVQSAAGGGFAVIFEDPEGDIFSESNIKFMRKLENELRDADGFSDFCLKSATTGTCQPFRTVTNWFYPSQRNMSGMMIDIPDGTGTTLKDVKTVMNGLALQKDSSSVSYHFPEDFDWDAGKRKANHTRLAIGLGQPLEGYKNTDDRNYEQRVKAESWAKETLSPIFEKYRTEYEADAKKVRIYWGGTGLSQKHILDLILGDVPLLTVSIVFVCGYIIFHTQSVFASVLGILHILMAFPFTYFAMIFILGYVYIGMFDLLSFFVIIGIGADDIFVVIDAFKQAKYQRPGISGSLLTRVDWSYRRAAKAMLITSLTTVGAFAANSLSPIPFISEFGAVSACLVVFNYLLVITWYPAIIVLWERRTEKARAQKESLALSQLSSDVVTEKRDETPTVTRVTSSPRSHPSLTTESTDPHVPATSPDEQEMMADLTATDPRTLSKSQEMEKGLGTNSHQNTSQDAKSDDVKEIVKGGEVVTKDPKKRGLIRTSTEMSIDLTPENFRFTERYFYFVHSKLVFRYRYWIIILFILGVGTATYFATGLKPATSDSSFLPENHGFRKMENILKDEFGGGDGNFGKLSIVWGIKGLDTSGINKLDVEDVGEVVWDDDFKPQEKASQTYLVKVCEDIATHAKYALDSHEPCLWTSFREWVVSSNMTFPVEPSTFISRIQQPHFTFWEKFVNEINADAPSGVKGAMHTSMVWVRMASRRSIVTLGYNGVAVSIGVAFILLTMMTRNALTGFIATLSIASIVAFVFAVIVGLGWTISAPESICMTILVGLSVDYTCHFAAAYADNFRFKSRYGRMRHALLDLGVSIFGSTVTSLGCSLVLLLTYITFMSQFGVFLSVTIGFSALTAFLIFPALMMIMGPNAPEEYGSFIGVGKWIQLKCMSKAKKNAVEPLK